MNDYDLLAEDSTTAEESPAPADLCGTLNPLLDDQPATCETSSSCIIRPSDASKSGLTFMWEKGRLILELVFRKLALLFAIYENGKVQYVETFGPDNLKPNPNFTSLVLSKAVRLPSEAVECGSIGALARQVREFISRYFDCEDTFLSVATTYVLMSWVYEAIAALPYLRLKGLLGSGKSRGTETIGSLCYRPTVIAGVATSAALFRAIGTVGGTVLFDEADFQNTSVGADLVKVLNMGYQRGLPIIRNESRPGGQGYDLVVFDPYCPKVIAGRKEFKDAATESRCLSYSPKATHRTDIPRQLPPSFEEEARDIRNQLLMYRFRNLNTFQVREEHISSLSPRTNQILLPLLTIADSLDSDRAEHGRCYRDDLIEFAKRQDERMKAEQSFQMHHILLEAYCAAEGDDPVLVAEMVSSILENHGTADPSLKRWLNSKSASSNLREMGFETYKVSRGAAVRIASADLLKLKERYGLTN